MTWDDLIDIIGVSMTLLLTVMVYCYLAKGG